MSIDFTNLQIHPDALPASHPAQVARYAVPVPSGYLYSGRGDRWLRFPRPFGLRMAYDFDGIVSSVKERSSVQYRRGSSGRSKASLLDSYSVVVKTDHGFSAWGMVGDPRKGPCPLKVGDKVRIKDFVPIPFRYGGSDIFQDMNRLRLKGVITGQTRPPYYRPPFLIEGRMSGMDLSIYSEGRGVENLLWSDRDKAWHGGVGNDKMVRLASDSPLLQDK